MNLLIFLNSDIYCAKALRLLEGDLKDHNVRIVISRKVGKIEGLAPDLLELRGREYCEIEKQFEYKSYFYEDVNSVEAVAEFTKFAPDLMISIRFGQIMKVPLISISPFGVINLHSGILPKYRGVMASFWSILQGEKKLGITLHYIENNTIDTGEIIAFSLIEADYTTSLVANILNLYDGGCALISETLKKISQGEKVETINQKTLGVGSYFSYPKLEDLKRFKEKMKLWG